MKLRWTMSKDGIRRTNIAVQWRFSRDDLANLLAARLIASPFVYDSDGEVALEDQRRGKTIHRRRLPGVRVDLAIREQLRDHGEDSRHWWTDKYEEYPGEPTRTEVLTWCMQQVQQL